MAAAPNTFGDQQTSLDSPPPNWVVPTQSDLTNENTYFRCLYVGVAGNVKVHTVGGQDVVFVGVLAGTTLVGQFTRVWSTGTTATSLLGGY